MNEFDELAHDLEAQLRAVRYLLAETEALTGEQMASIDAAKESARVALARVAELRKTLLISRETLSARLAADIPTPRLVPEGLREAALPPPPGGLWTTETYVIPVTAAWGSLSGRSGSGITVDDLFAEDAPQLVSQNPSTESPTEIANVSPSDETRSKVDRDEITVDTLFGGSEGR